mmetsp:Transcript_30431/g.76215  ORF Transcript_30431/g.76215 Transcript_30431/m.76215 type:complete len:267 (-) Transcript_30431:517-1317(-)
MARTFSVHLARKSSSSYSFPRMAIQSRPVSSVRSVMKSSKRFQASRVALMSSANSSSTSSAGRSMEKCSQSWRTLFASSRNSSSARKSSSSLVIIREGSPWGIPLGLNSSQRSRNASALDVNSVILDAIWPLRFSFCVSRWVSSCTSLVDRFSHSESREEKSTGPAACGPEPPDCLRSLARSAACLLICVMRPPKSAMMILASLRMLPISSTVCALVSKSVLPETTNFSISSLWRTTLRCRHVLSTSCSSLMCFSTADLRGWQDTT